MAYVQGTLTAGELNNKRATYFHAPQYVSVSQNPVVFSASVNQATFANPLAALTYDTATGDYNDITPGMTVFIGTSSDIKRRGFVGRIRANATATQIFINETSFTFEDNMFITVIDDYRVWPVLLREVSGVQLLDWNLAYEDMRPSIYDVNAVYTGFVSSDTDNKLELTLSPNALATQQGETINAATWSWFLPAGVALEVGYSATDREIVVRCDAGEYWLSVSVDDTNGVSNTRRIKVFAHDADVFPVASGFNGASVTNRIGEGDSATVEAFDGIEDLLDGNLITIWTIPVYDGVESDVVIDCYGRFRSENAGYDGDEQYSVIRRDTSYIIEGIGQQLARLEMAKIGIEHNALPTAWNEITLPVLWRVIWHMLDRYTTLTQLVDVRFDDVSNTFALPSPYGFPQGAVMEAINEAADGIKAVCQFAPRGVLEVARLGSYLPIADRDALDTAAEWSDYDALAVSVDFEHEDSIGFVQLTGVTRNTTTETNTPLAAIAPGLAFGNAAGSTQVNDQILPGDVSGVVAQHAANERAGFHYGYMNRRTTMNNTLPDGYFDLVPAGNVWHEWALAELNRIPIEPTDRWFLAEITHTQDNETGTRQIDAQFWIETFQPEAQTLIFPESPIDNIIPDFPPFPAFPAFPEDPAIIYPIDDPEYIPPITISPIQPDDDDDIGNGEIAMIAVDNDAWTTDHFRSIVNPSWLRVTPPMLTGEIIQDGDFGSLHHLFFLSYHAPSNRSRIWRGQGLYSGAGLTWTPGAWLDGEWTQFDRWTTRRDNETLVIGSPSVQVFDDGTWIAEWDFRVSQYDWIEGGTGGSRTWVSGEGLRWIYGTGGTTSNWRINFLEPLLGTEFTIDDISMDYSVTGDIDPGSGTKRISIGANLTGTANSIAPARRFRIEPVVSGADQFFFGDTLDADSPASEYDTFRILYSMTAADTAGTLTVHRLRLSGTSEDAPPVSSSVHATAFTDDAGVTFSVRSPGAEINDYDYFGFTTAGASILRRINAGTNGGLIRRAQGDGFYTASYATLPTGAFAGCIVQPRFKFDGNTNWISSPDFIVGSPAAVAGESMWRITDGGATLTDITPSFGGNPGLVFSPNCIAASRGLSQEQLDENRTAAILNVSGTKRLFVRTDTGGWVHRAAIGANADYIQFRRGDATGLELYWVDGAPQFSNNFGATVIQRQSPTSTPLKLIRVLS